MKNQQQIQDKKSRRDKIVNEGLRILNLVILTISLSGIILGFWMFFLGFHNVDLFVNRVVLFNTINAGYGEHVLDIDDFEEVGIVISTGEQLTITNIELYSRGIRLLFLGMLMTFASSAIFSTTLFWIMIFGRRISVSG